MDQIQNSSPFDEPSSVQDVPNETPNLNSEGHIAMWPDQRPQPNRAATSIMGAVTAMHLVYFFAFAVSLAFIAELYTQPDIAGANYYNRLLPIFTVSAGWLWSQERRKERQDE